MGYRLQRFFAESELERVKTWVTELFKRTDLEGRPPENVGERVRGRA